VFPLSASTPQTSTRRADRARAREGRSGLETRTPEQVLASHRRALAARDWAEVRLNYADDAVVISDMGVTAGADAIVADLKAIVASLGPAVPTVRRQEMVPLDERTHMV